MSSPELRVACFSPYPASAPSPRHRVLAYRASWHRAGVALTFWPFMSERLYKIRKRFSALSTAEKALWFGAATMLLLLRVLRVRRFDAIIIHREIFPVGGAVLDRMVAFLNPRVYFDLDDAIWFPPSHRVNQRGRYLDPTRTAQVMALSYHVVAGNSYIQDYARQFNRRVSVVPTSYDDIGGPKPRPPGARPVLVWIGSWGNAEYLEPVLPALATLREEFAFDLRLIGGPDVFDIRVPGVAIDARLWVESDEAELLRDADIGLMPLYDRDHERGKCAFKLVQYHSAGLAVVASPVGANREVIEHGGNGYLAAGPDEWLACLRALLGSRELRLAMGRAGYATFRERYCRAQCAEQWLALLAAA